MRKHIPYLTLTEISKATTKSWFSRLRRHSAKKWSGSMLGHTLIYLLTCSGPTQSYIMVTYDNNSIDMCSTSSLNNIDYCSGSILSMWMHIMVVF